MFFRLFTVFLLISCCIPAKSYRIECNFFYLQEGEVRLIRYEGKKLFEVERAQTDKNGVLILEGDDPLPCGLYVVALPDGVSFELLIPEHDQNFQIFAEYPGIQNTLRVRGNAVIEEFVAYQRAFIKLSNAQDDVRRRLLSHFQEKDSVQNLKIENERLDRMRTITENKFMELNRDNILGEYIYWSQRLQTPLFASTYADTVLHALRNIGIPGECLLYSPLFEVFMEGFYKTIEKLYVRRQQEAIDILLRKMAMDDKRYQFVLSNLYNRYNQPRDAEKEGVFYHIVRQYYVNNKPPWVSITLKNELEKLVNDQYLTLLGDFFPTLPGPVERSLPGYKKQRSYLTWLVFVNNDCKSCFDLLRKLEREYGDDDKHVFYVLDMGDKITTNRLSVFPGHWYISNHFTKSDDIMTHLKIRQVPQVYVLDNRLRIQAKGTIYTQLEQQLQKWEGQHE